MVIVDMLLVGVGLSMDAFAASLCQGLSASRINWRHAFVTALSFGVFQAGMPLIGYALGSSFAYLIEPVDHWVAFILLACVGGKMIWDAFHQSCDVPSDLDNDHLDVKRLLALSVATSIDALVVGITFSMSGMDIWLASAVIGITTFSLSLAGYAIGNRFGANYERAATMAGGIALILLGLKILFEHLLG